MSTAIFYRETSPLVPDEDGITAAFIANERHKDADLFGVPKGVTFDADLITPGQYDRIIVIDFLFPREVLDKWSESAGVTILAHRCKSDVSSLQGFRGAVFAFYASETLATLARRVFFPELNPLSKGLKELIINDE